MTTFPSKEIVVTGCNNCPLFVHEWENEGNACNHPDSPVGYNPDGGLAQHPEINDSDVKCPSWCPLKEQKSIQITFKPEEPAKEQGNWCHPNP